MVRKLSVTLADFLANNRRDFVFVCGCFDLLHPGHIFLLDHAVRSGYPVVVGLNSDESCRRLKNKLPIFNEYDRRLILLALWMVDDCFIFDCDDAREVVKQIKPILWYIGSDHQRENFDLQTLGCKVVFVERQVEYASSQIKKFIAERDKNGADQPI